MRPVFLLPLHLLASASLALVGCGDDGPTADAAIADAGPDAFNPCGSGNVQLTGEYVDWDSTDADFHGVAGATVTVVGDPANTDTTAPNGRSALCLPDAQGAAITLTQADYLPARYTMVPAAAARGSYSMRGLTPARLETLFGQDLDAEHTADTALVLVEVRGFPSGVPVVGVTVAVSTGDLSYVQSAAGAWLSGDALLDGGGAHVLVTNVPIGPPVAVSLDAGDRDCVGPSAIQVAAGELAYTTFACRD